MTSDLSIVLCHCDVSQETAAIHFDKNRTGLLRLALQVSQCHRICPSSSVIAGFRKKPRQSILLRTALDCIALRCKSHDIGFVLRSQSLRGFARNRGNPCDKSGLTALPTQKAEPSGSASRISLYRASLREEALHL